MEPEQKRTAGGVEASLSPSFKLLFVETRYNCRQCEHICKDAISSNSIPAFRQGAIPGLNSDQTKLKIQLGVPRSTQHLLDAERVKSVFPYGRWGNDLFKWHLH